MLPRQSFSSKAEIAHPWQDHSCQQDLPMLASSTAFMDPSPRLNPCRMKRRNTSTGCETRTSAPTLEKVGEVHTQQKALAKGNGRHCCMQSHLLTGHWLVRKVLMPLLHVGYVRTGERHREAAFTGCSVGLQVWVGVEPTRKQRPAKQRDPYRAPEVLQLPRSWGLGASLCLGEGAGHSKHAEEPSFPGAHIFC